MAAYTKNLTINDDGPVLLSGDDDAEPLLYILRNQAGQHGPKFGCGVAQCGACTVLVDGAIVRSCVTAISRIADGASVRTMDGIGTPDDPHPLQAAMIEGQAGQCAFCVCGVLMGSIGWLEARARAGDTSIPERDEIRAFLSGHLPDYGFNYICRCGAHPRYVEAIRDAAKEMLS